MIPTCKIRISGTGSYTPERVVTNQELAELAPTSPTWVYERLGIRERRVVAPGQLSSDLAAAAGEAALAASGLSGNDIDLLLVATSTPDRKAPSTACLVKNKLRIDNLCPAFDISAVCSGFIYALATAGHLIESGAYSRALVIGSDTFSRITDWTRRDCVFFGDGAGAVVVEASDYPKAMLRSLLFSETSNTDHFTVFPEDEHFTMNARAVYETGSSVLPHAIRAVLRHSSLGLRDVACVIPHQPSITLLRKTREELDLPASVLKTNMEQYANTSAATIPLLLDETARRNEIKPDDLVVFAAVGSGWTWGAAVYRWH